MKRNENATCGTCPFWHQDKDIKKGGGECRINEPKLFTFPDNVYYVWLYTKPSDWCGQHPEFWMPVENMHPCCVQMPDTCRTCTRRRNANKEDAQ